MVSSATRSREQLVEAIRQENRSASLEFLLGFDDRALKTYLDRLQLIHGHRGRTSVWVRTGETPAIVTRRQQ